MTGTGTHLVVAQGDIHVLVQTIFNTPMQTHRPIQACRIGWQAADVEAMLNAGLAFDRSLSRNHGKRLQIWPALRCMWTVKLRKNIAAAQIKPAVILLDPSLN